MSLHRRIGTSSSSKAAHQNPESNTKADGEGERAELRADEGQALPAPSEMDAVVRLDVGGKGVRLDAMGPLVVNSDGSTGQVANWVEMTQYEKETTLRLLARRNKQRLEAIRTTQGGSGG
jgi:hypothetical protein